MLQPRPMQVGTVQALPLAVLQERERAREAEVSVTQNSPLTTSLAAHVRRCWTSARDAKRLVELRMLQSMRARRGEYDPEKLAAIQQQGGAEIYAMLTSVKCRAAGSWIKDVLSANGTEKPWTIRPTPSPDMPPQINDAIVATLTRELAAAMQAGIVVTDDQIMTAMQTMRDQAKNFVLEQARQHAERMETKMHDQLVEGGFTKAVDQFTDDITTFPAAFIKGPVVRRRKRLSWANAQGGKPTAVDELRYEWERVSPFDIYPSPSATNVDDGFLIERHRLPRSELLAMIGVEGYDEASIRGALTAYAVGGLNEWLYADDTTRRVAEGKHLNGIFQNPDGLIDALQFWGTVPGRLLIEWGMKPEEVPEPTAEYSVEVWIVGNYVIKAVVNPDPLARKPYYKASYEEVPGSFWGNSVADLVRDAQQVVNAAARAMVNNMGMASGPQVVVNVSRLPQGETIGTLVPWRTWQVQDDPITGSTGAGTAQAPIQFYQPESRVQELMAIFEKFSQMADEYSGIPRYLTGETSGGAGRTASGLSMLINNAGKSIKQVIANIDVHVLAPVLERLYLFNMQYATDPDLKGDVNIVAQGANALVAKESAQVRRNEFLAATGNPIDMQVIGIEGRAAILRETAKSLDMDPDKVVPPLEVLRQRQAAMMIAQQQQAALPAPGGSPKNPANNQQELMDGAAVTDNFSPPAQA